MMLKFLTCINHIKDHPILALNKDIQENYIRGVGEFLCYIDSDSSNLQVAFDIFSNYLYGSKLTSAWKKTNEFKNTLNVQRFYKKDYSWFKLIDCFWWDIFNILYLSNIPISRTEDKLDYFIKTYVRSRKVRDIIINAKNYFSGNGNGKKLNPILLRYSDRNFKFLSKSKKSILIVGTMSAGKSTFINSLIGEKVAEVKSTVCTNRISFFYNRPLDDHIIYNVDDDFEVTKKCNSDLFSKQYISIKFKGLNKNQPFVLIDSPGIDYAYDHTHQEITEKYISSQPYDIIVCVIDTQYIQRDGELDLINKVLKLNKDKTIFVLNKLDKFNPEDDSLKNIINKFKDSIKQINNSAIVVPYSSKFSYLIQKEYNAKVLSPYEQKELKQLKVQMSQEFFDLAKYSTGEKSRIDDYRRRSGLEILEKILLS